TTTVGRSGESHELFRWFTTRPVDAGLPEKLIDTAKAGTRPKSFCATLCGPPRQRLREDRHSLDRLLLNFSIGALDAKCARRNDFSMLAMRNGRVFCLVISRSVEHGKSPFETAASRIAGLRLIAGG